MMTTENSISNKFGKLHIRNFCAYPLSSKCCINNYCQISMNLLQKSRWRVYQYKTHYKLANIDSNINLMIHFLKSGNLNERWLAFKN